MPRRTGLLLKGDTIEAYEMAVNDAGVLPWDQKDANTRVRS